MFGKEILNIQLCQYNNPSIIDYKLFIFITFTKFDHQTYYEIRLYKAWTDQTTR